MIHLYFLQTTDDVKTEIEAIEKKASENHIRVQPYAIVVEKDLSEITESYVWYDGIQHKVNSPRDAVDVTFKVIHALHADYPKQSECHWLLLQKGIYKIRTPWDKENYEVDILIEKLRLK